MTDEFFKTIRRKSDEGGDRARAAEAAQTSRFRVRSTRGARSRRPIIRTRARLPAFIHSSYFGCQTTKKSRPSAASPQEAGPLLTSLYGFFRDSRSGRPAPPLN